MSNTANAPVVSEQQIIQGLNQVSGLMMQVGVTAGETSQELMNEAVNLSGSMNTQASEHLHNVETAQGYQKVMAWVAPMAMTLVQGLLAAEYAGGDTTWESAKTFGKTAIKGLQVGAFGMQITQSVLGLGSAYYKAQASKNQGNLKGLETTQGVLTSVATSIGQLTDESVKTSTSVFASELETILNNGKATRPQNT
ncbi:MAG: hypothetical protein SP1CHLAM54_17670 [Chlamydiia bacterium]|nr:hypothetical protein [Chlamydiia bacterium]MCH9616655.1 hypothetical protein [Chlamydiia bacterium]MCH9629385.1 hypothetical protein [Chlamydiia bacterium]